MNQEQYINWIKNVMGALARLNKSMDFMRWYGSIDPFYQVSLKFYAFYTGVEAGIELLKSQRN